MYVVPVRWEAGTRTVSLHLAGDGEAVDTTALELPAPPPPPPPPGLRFVDRLSLSLELGAGSMLSAYQQNRDPQAFDGNARGYGLSVQGGAALSLELIDPLAVQLSARVWLFPTDLTTVGEATVDAVGVRFTPRISNRVRLVGEAEAGVAFTGGLVRFAATFGVGVDVRATRSLSFAPMVRYGQILQLDDSVNTSLDEDARFWSAGLAATLRLPR